METWRLAALIGNSFADGWSEPFWQKAGFCAGRIRDVNQARPF